MKLSVVIVNYNVRDLLSQCLTSVFRSAQAIETEVFVVDNHSSDDSCAMLITQFPQVKLIANKENLGFSAANNQAIRLSAGEYVLLLNPDTVIGENTLNRACRFMDEHPETGGLGVRMINAEGRFLPESKRSLPTTWVSFCKIVGLTSLFPKSRVFGRYSLRYLDEHAVHEVDVLAGAFMLLRRAALDQVGLLDERFFMYGEDIDLSYRLQLGGYKNYYLPETILHYKGESTAKDSLRYVRVFYESMLIFYRKHRQRNGFFTLFVKAAIGFRASLAILARLLKRALYSPARIYSQRFTHGVQTSASKNEPVLASENANFEDFIRSLETVKK